MHLAETSNLAKSPPNRVRLVCHSLDSEALRNRDEARFFTESWNRLRQYGHAPVLVLRCSRPLGEALGQIEELELALPEYLICGAESMIYDNCSQEVLAKPDEAGLEHEEWALEWLLERLDIAPEAMLRAGDHFHHNQDLIDRMMDIEARETVPPF